MRGNPVICLLLFYVYLKLHWDKFLRISSCALQFSITCFFVDFNGFVDYFGTKVKWEGKRRKFHFNQNFWLFLNWLLIVLLLKKSKRNKNGTTRYWLTVSTQRTLTKISKTTPKQFLIFHAVKLNASFLFLIYIFFLNFASDSVLCYEIKIFTSR